MLEYRWSLAHSILSFDLDHLLVVVAIGNVIIGAIAHAIAIGIATIQSRQLTHKGW